MHWNLNCGRSGRWTLNSTSRFDDFFSPLPVPDWELCRMPQILTIRPEAEGAGLLWTRTDGERAEAAEASVNRGREDVWKVSRKSCCCGEATSIRPRKVLFLLRLVLHWFRTSPYEAAEKFFLFSKTRPAELKYFNRFCFLYESFKTIQTLPSVSLLI